MSQETSGNPPHDAGDAEPEAIADRLHSAAVRLLRALRREDDAAALSAPLLSALSVLTFAGATSLKALAEAEQVRPASMSRTIAALEARGLVRREPDPADRRAVRLTATARGAELMRKGRRRRADALRERLGGLRPEERARLEAALPVLERLAGSGRPG